MGAISLLFNRNGEPVNKKIFNNIFSSLDFHGVDGRNISYFNDIALGFQHFYTTPEEIGEKQPVRSADGNYLILFDGRIDNRKELFDRLEINKDFEKYSDSKLVLECFQRFNSEVFKDLLGSFVFVIYNIKNSDVYAVRDQLGNKALYYYLDNDVFIIASEERAILEHPSVSKKINHKRVAIYFALVEKDDDSTFFKDVKELLPAHFLTVKRDKSNNNNYWNLQDTSKIKYKNEYEYFDHFRELLEKSINSCLRSNYPPAVIMSGGLDSTSIASLTASLLREKDELSKLKTVSLVFNNRDISSCDESIYIDELNSFHSVNSIKINSDNLVEETDLSNSLLNPNSPLLSYDYNLYSSIYEELQREHRVTFLNGWFGDELFAYSNHWLYDLFAEKEYSQFFNEIYDHIFSYGIGWAYKDLALRVFIKKFFNIGDIRKKGRKRKWLSDNANNLIGDTSAWIPNSLSYHKNDQLTQIFGLTNNNFYTSINESIYREPIDIRFPYKDRRIVEFIVNIPNYMLYDKGSTKNKKILRKSLQDILPKKILERKTATAFNPILNKIVNQNFEYIRDNLNLDNDYLNKIDFYKPKLNNFNKVDEVPYLIWISATFSKWVNNFDYIF